MYRFTSQIEIVDSNPFVEIPNNILTFLLHDAQKEKGPIPVRGTIQTHPYLQTVVKFRGLWRLYINGPMLADSQTQVGDTVDIEIEYDPVPRTTPIPQLLLEALASNKKAQETFHTLPPYRQKEISRYLNNLKSEEALKRYIENVMKFLTGEKVSGVLLYRQKK